MLFYLEPNPMGSGKLLGWPPLRVQSKATGVQFRPVGELVYLESQGNYTWLNWVDGSRTLVAYTLKRVWAKLPPGCFLRLHRHYLVNHQFVERLGSSSARGYQVYLLTGVCLPVSSRQWGLLRKQLKLSVKLMNTYRQSAAFPA
jgi:DNA-binding LytR/AlgR family response regulator